MQLLEFIPIFFETLQMLKACFICNPESNHVTVLSREQRHTINVYIQGCHSDISNYRPVSLISCVSKTFERVIHKHLYNNLISNSLLYKYLSGFIPGNSTAHHLIEPIHRTCLALENYETCCHIFCKGILHKLKGYEYQVNY